MNDKELSARTCPPAREKRPPSAVRSRINRTAHARAIEFERQERERLLAAYLAAGCLPDDM